MRTIVGCFLLILIQGCSVGSYYVFRGTEQPAIHTEIYKDENLTITLFHFDGSASSLLVSVEEDSNISIQNIAITIENSGKLLPLKSRPNMPVKVSSKDGITHSFSFSYVVGSKPEYVTEMVEFTASQNKSDLRVSKQFTLEEKFYGWLEATKGI